MEDKIKRAIEHIRPQLQADGGDIEFVKFDEEGKPHSRPDRHHYEQEVRYSRCDPEDLRQP